MYREVWCDFSIIFSVYVAIFLNIECRSAFRMFIVNFPFYLRFFSSFSITKALLIFQLKVFRKWWLTFVVFYVFNIVLNLSNISSMIHIISKIFLWYLFCKTFFLNTLIRYFLINILHVRKRYLSLLLINLNPHFGIFPSLYIIDIYTYCCVLFVIFRL